MAFHLRFHSYEVILMHSSIIIASGVVILLPSAREKKLNDLLQPESTVKFVVSSIS